MNRSQLFTKMHFIVITCDMLVPASQPSTTCKNCQKQNVIRNSEINCKQANRQIPGQLNAAIKFAFYERVKLTIQHHRLQCTQLELRIEKIRTALEKYSENVTAELSNDLVTIYSGSEQNNIPSSMKLFWEDNNNNNNLFPAKKGRACRYGH